MKINKVKKKDENVQLFIYAIYKHEILYQKKTQSMIYKCLYKDNGALHRFAIFMSRIVSFFIISFHLSTFFVNTSKIKRMQQQV